MNETPKSVLVTPEKREMEIPFPLAKELFAFAQESGLGESSYSEYVRDIEGGEVNPNAVPLPAKFSPFVADFPGQYYVVAFESRIGNYYAKGTRYKMTLISNTDYRKKSNDRTREICVKEPDISEDKGNVLFLTVSESVNEKGVSTLNEAINHEVNLPHGSTNIEYKINFGGQKRLTSLQSKRLDEEFFAWKGTRKQVRWLRDLSIDNNEVTSITTYRDTYLIGLKPEGGSEEFAEITWKIKGTLIAPESVDVCIGYPSGKGEILFEDTERNVQIIFHKSSVRPDSQLEILQQDPSYAFLFETPFDLSKLLAVLRSKVKGLEEDWDKPSTIFSTTHQIAQDLPQIQQS